MKNRGSHFDWKFGFLVIVLNTIFLFDLSLVVGDARIAPGTNDTIEWRFGSYKIWLGLSSFHVWEFEWSDKQCGWRDILRESREQRDRQNEEIRRMCDKIILGGRYYICSECWQELLEYKETWDLTKMQALEVESKIVFFMKTLVKTYINKDTNEEAVEDEFRRLTSD